MRWELKPREPAATGGTPDFSLQGFGADALGGEGQTVNHVTSLVDDYNTTGSLRRFLETGDGSNQYIVFDVGGTINLAQHLTINGHHITIDGTTAPSPGITFINDIIEIGGGGPSDFPHHIVIKGVRHRGGGGDDNFGVVQANDIAFDHVSSSQAADGAIDITADSYNVTLQWCILKMEGTPTGASLIKYNTYGVTLHHCIYRSWERGPLTSVDETSTGSSQTMCDIVNNINWQWGENGGTGYGYGIGVDHGAHVNVTNSFFQSDGTYPNTEDFAIELDHNGSGGKCYASGNYSGNGVDVDAIGNVGTPYAAPSVTTDSVADAVTNVLTYAGCRGDLFGLDATDQSIVDDITNNGNLP